MFSFRTHRRAVEVAFTDRHGGVSSAPFGSLNLAINGDDDPASRQRNLEMAVASFGASTSCGMDQVHGADVVEVRDGELTPSADALLTDQPDLALIVRVADCVPVLLAAADTDWIAAVHAGRVGLYRGVVEATLAALRERQAGPLHAWVGPSVCGSCYEVSPQLHDDVARKYPQAASRTPQGTPALDVSAGVCAVLRDYGVTVEYVETRCTREDPDLYSYRRDGAAAGRLAGMIMRRALP